MNSHAATGPLPGSHSATGVPRTSMPAPRSFAAILACVALAGAGLLAGSRHAHDTAKASAARAGSPAPIRAAGPSQIEAARAALRKLGMMSIAFCDAACAGELDAAVKIVAKAPQAVIVTAATPATVDIVHRLRAAGSGAMLVIAGAADSAEVVPSLPASERTWLAAIVPAGPAQGSERVRIVPFARDGSLLD